MQLVDISEKRVERANSSEDVSVRDMLKESLRAIEKKEMNPQKCILVFIEEKDDGTIDVDTLRAGEMIVAETVGLLMLEVVWFLSPNSEAQP